MESARDPICRRKVNVVKYRAEGYSLNRNFQDPPSQNSLAEVDNWVFRHVFFAQDFSGLDRLLMRYYIMSSISEAFIMEFGVSIKLEQNGKHNNPQLLKQVYQKLSSPFFPFS